VAERYDVVIIGTGAGGGTLAHALAGSGKTVLLLERGDFLPREMGNWDPRTVFVEGKYISAETWFGADGKPFHPQVHYFVGGATKLYGAALYRLRPEDSGNCGTWTGSRRRGRCRMTPRPTTPRPPASTKS
jgi:choline dehydrogenase-like flavoprotein